MKCFKEAVHSCFPAWSAQQTTAPEAAPEHKYRAQLALDFRQVCHGVEKVKCPHAVQVPRPSVMFTLSEDPHTQSPI